jgi:hypothetical protein
MNYLVFISIIVVLLLYLNYKNNKITVFSNQKNVDNKHKLIRLLDNVSSADKLYLKNVKNRWIYNRNTIDEDIKVKILHILKIIIKSIGNISNMDFFIKSIENVYAMQDDELNVRLIIDSFIYDVKNFYTIRITTDVVKVKDTIFINYLDIDESSVNNIINKYDIKYKSQGILSNYNMFNEDIEELLNNYYNSNYNTIGIDKNTFLSAYTDLSKTFTLNQLSLYYLPVNTPLQDSPAFCRKYNNKWNTKGILQLEEYNDSECIFNTNTGKPYPNVPYDAPGVVTERIYNNLHHRRLK